jgi:hypothetical protein
MGVPVNHSDKIASGLLLALVGAIFIVTDDFPLGPNVTGPAFYPRVIGALIALFAVVQVVKSIVTEDAESHMIDQETAKRVAIPLGLIIAYVVSMPNLGFLLATIGFLVVTMRYSGVNDVIQSLGLSVGIALVLFYVFRQFLRVPLPLNSFFPFERLLPFVSTMSVSGLFG